MLDVKKINVFRGDLEVIWDASFKVNENEIVAILGSNGAGKTTLLETLMGLLHPKSGSINFLGEQIDNLSPDRIVDLGCVLVPEGRHLFSNMSVQENLELGAYPKTVREVRHERMEWLFQAFPILKERRTQIAGTLSGGEQQMLAIGRGLMSKPKFMMLDEPSSGLAPSLVLKLFQLLEKLNDEGITILLVEQNVRSALEIADRGYVIETGRITLEGTAAQLTSNEQLKKAYLGM